MTTKREALADVQPVQSRKVANNTYEWTDETGNRHIRLHHTDIVTFRPDGSVVLDSGGWRTVTTKARMNDWINAHVWQERGQWFVTDYSRDNTVPFVDGIVLPSPFRVPQPTKRQQAKARADKKLQARINRFAAQIDKLDAMPEPNAGDCWFCAMFEQFDQGEYTPENGGRIANPGYRSTRDTSHLRAHITVKENYLHGSLIRNAYLWAGGSMFLWDMHRQRWDKWAKDSAKRNLRRYLKAQLSLTA